MIGMMGGLSTALAVELQTLHPLMTLETSLKVIP